MFSRVGVTLGMLAASLIVGCEDTPQAPELHMDNIAAYALPEPDPSFHLSPAQRDKLHPTINADVLERMLAWYQPEYRAELIRTLNEISIAGPVAISVASTGIDHPEIRSLAEKLIKVPPSGRQIRNESSP